MKTSEKRNGTQVLEVTLAKPTNGDGLSSMPEAFAGMFQAGYDSGYRSGHEAGYRQGLEAGRLEGQAALPQSGNARAAAAPESNAAVIPQSRLFGLPCTKCRRLMYSDEDRCPYCKAPKAALAGPPIATREDLGEVRRAALADLEPN